jgi:hypothetical protein
MTTATSEICCTTCGHTAGEHMGCCYHVMSEKMPFFDCQCDLFVAP